MPSLLQPIDRADRLALSVGDTYFEVWPEHGARITSLRQAGLELLSQTGAPNYAEAFGSTFWPSPQRWPWPPPAELDHYPYRTSIDASGAIVAESAVHAGTSLKLIKRFRADRERESIVIEYAMHNAGTAPVSWAPWEITRLPSSGLAFWPTGSAPTGSTPLRAEAELGHTWCSPDGTPGEAKLFADGAGGYLAYLLGDRLLIKRFDDIESAAAAPNEAEIELYVNAQHSYLELENQGAYVSMEPGQGVTYGVEWYARRLPAGLRGGASRADLVAFVAKTLE